MTKPGTGKRVTLYLPLEVHQRALELASATNVSLHAYFRALILRAIRAGWRAPAGEDLRSGELQPLCVICAVRAVYVVLAASRRAWRRSGKGEHLVRGT